MTMTPDEAQALSQGGTFLLIVLALYAAIVALIADHVETKRRK